MPIWMRAGSKACHCHGNHRKLLISYQIKSLKILDLGISAPFKEEGKKRVTRTVRLLSLIKIIVAQRQRVAKWGKG